MATVNFSVPDEVKAAFDRTFEGQNKSAVIAELMRRALLHLCFAVPAVGLVVTRNASLRLTHAKEPRASRHRVE